MKEKLKKIPPKYIVAGVVLIVMLLLLVKHRSIFYNSNQDNYNDMSGEEENIAAEDAVVSQYFTISGNMQNIALLMTNDSGEDITIHAVLRDADTAEVLSNIQCNVPKSTGAEEVVNLELVVDGIDGTRNVCLDLEEVTKASEVYYCALSGDYAQTLLVNGQTTTERLRMSVVYGGGLNKTFFILFALGMAVVIGIFVMPVKWAKPENMVLILVSVMGLSMAVINPAFQECDGPSHFYRSMDVSYGNILGSFVNLTHEDGVIYVPENVQEIAYRQLTPNGSEGTAYMEYLKSHKFSKNKIKMTYYDSVTSVVYWPQGLGIFLGRTFNFSIYGVILMGRIFNLLAYMGLAYAAVRFMPFYKNLMAMFAVMPLSIYQASSLSQDAVLNGVGFLFVALCCYYAFDEKVKLNWKKTLVLGLLLLLMFLSKYVYACLGLLVFMIPKDKFNSRKDYWKSFIIALLPFVILGGYVMLRVSSGISGLQAGAGGGADTMTQMQYLKMYPAAAVKVIISTLLVNINAYLMQLNILGSMNYPLTLFLVFGPCFLLGVGLLDGQEVRGRIKIRHRIIMLLAFAITFAAIMMGLYIGDGIANPVGSSVINGIQGRYFILMLVLPFLALGSDRVKQDIRHFTVKCSGIMGIMLLYAVFMLVNTCY